MEAMWYLSATQLRDLKSWNATLLNNKYFSNGKKLLYLNELEFINGDIFANVYLTDKIVQLDLKKDIVKRQFDFSFLLEKASKLNAYRYFDYLKEDECLNGIAYDPKTKRLILTGKNWPVMFDVWWDDPMFNKWEKTEVIN